MARIGKKLEGELKKATRRYNTIVNRYNRQNPNKPQMANVRNKQILSSDMKADEIRLQIRLMNLLQSEQDFVRPKAGDITPYERAQLDYLRRRQRTDLSRTLNRMLKQEAERLLKGGMPRLSLEAVKLKAEIEALKKEPKTAASALRQFERAKRRQENKIKYGTYEAPSWVEVTRDHFLAAMDKCTLDNTVAGEKAMRVITGMTNEQFSEFLKENPHITIDYVYNTKYLVDVRASTILSALQAYGAKHGLDVPDDNEYEYEDTDGWD